MSDRTPGASIGVLHEDKVIYKHNYGYRDVEAQIAPDDRTIFHIASLSKSFTAAGIGILVEEAKMSWNTPIREILPDFKHRLSGQTWGTFLRDRILTPLGLDRTISEHSSRTENVAQAYMALSDGSPVHLPRPSVEDGVLMEGAVGLQSSVRDLLTYAQNLIEAANDQKSRQTTSTEGSPLKQLPTILQGHINLSQTASELERSYTLGWIHTMLPGPLGTVGLNPMYVDVMPLVGKGLTEPEMIIHHQGSLVDFLSSIHLIPSTRAAVVVLRNSMSINNAADWLGQLILEAIIDNPDQNDYVKLAKDSVEASNHLWVRMAEKLEESLIPDTPMRELSSYEGSYYNIVKDWQMEIWLEERELYMCHQDDRSQSYQLKHYNYDTFSWLLTRNETVRRGLFPVTLTEYYLLAFGQGQDGQIDHVIWKHDPSVPKGETFKRLSGSAPQKGLPLMASAGTQNVLGAKG
ncbi:hypothetical protein MMC11_001470 [Xylographa trunciseda]|nr:hypothetical protein [Xylographa trunciseda]